MASLHIFRKVLKSEESSCEVVYLKETDFTDVTQSARDSTSGGKATLQEVVNASIKALSPLRTNMEGSCSKVFERCCGFRRVENLTEPGKQTDLYASCSSRNARR